METVFVESSENINSNSLKYPISSVNIGDGVVLSYGGCLLKSRSIYKISSSRE